MKNEEESKGPLINHIAISRGTRAELNLILPLALD
jgi:hypothetical protein